MRKKLIFAIIILAVMALLCAIPARADEKPARKPGGRTEISKTPWTPGARAPGKVVYGTDDRRDVFEETDADRRSWADSTCALVDASALAEQEDGTFSLTLSGYRILGLPACEDEPFRDQPSAAYCTGFMVGPDLIATAGHCYSEFELPVARFVFGFRMLDAATPKTTFEASEVYTGIEVVARQLEGDFDYSIIRVDRPIEAPGAEILPLRSAGTIPVGTHVGVIGHPVGLPAKIAFGESTVVRDSANAGYFVANLDAFGGNSGSPVFNADTGLVEGILVRGEQDFEFEELCFRSRVFPNNGGHGEEISKSATFARFVQTGRGTISLDRSAYPCAGNVEITLFDYDLREVDTVDVALITSGGDSETVSLEETGRIGTFSATVALTAGDVVEDDGALQAAEGETILATYRDDDTGNGAPGDSVATARVDCTAPVITDVSVSFTGGNRARIAFTTSDPAIGTITAGLDCATRAITASGDLATSHEIELSGLAPTTGYFFSVAAADPAGNTAADDNGGACFTFTTTNDRDYFTQSFFDGTSDLVGETVTFTPDGSASGYSACTAPAEGFPTSPFCGESLAPGDDGFVEYTLQSGRTVSFFGEEYDSFFVGGNGYVTFGEGDNEYYSTLESHFDRPRISGYYSDLYSPAGGLISVAELDDRVAISYYNVPDYYGDIQSFQIELFDDGAIRLTWIALTYPYGIIGLSDGSGLDADFEESRLSGYTACAASPYEDIVCDVDVDNDACGSAIPATLGETYTGLTHSSMGSNEIPGCEHCYDPDVWYTFTPAASGTYSFSLCDSGFDTVIDVYAGDCGALEFIGGNDDGPCGYQSAAAALLTSGETYWIRISGYAASTGNYELMITRGAKASFGCNAGSGVPGDPVGEVLLMAVLVILLAWRARERRA